MTSINDSTLMPAALRDTRRMNQFVSVAAAVAGLLFGLDIGVIAGALPFITDHFTLSNRLQEWVVSSMMLGAAIGALFNGWLSFRLGRKYSLMGWGDPVRRRLHRLRVCDKHRSAAAFTRVAWRSGGYRVLHRAALSL